MFGSFMFGEDMFSGTGASLFVAVLSAYLELLASVTYRELQVKV
jgi:hypothetical protein